MWMFQTFLVVSMELFTSLKCLQTETLVKEATMLVLNMELVIVMLNVHKMLSGSEELPIVKIGTKLKEKVLLVAAALKWIFGKQIQWMKPILFILALKMVSTRVKDLIVALEMTDTKVSVTKMAVT